ncbi:MAG: Crp/Fnr family transcriptional regulator [Rhodobacteraceae bacterium]|nr:Crp/Fnr family transcriptional regulator [Paracoccaceae bacterium]
MSNAPANDLPFQAPQAQVLFRPGDSCPGLILLEAGSIRVTLTAANGRSLVLYRVRPGDMCLQSFACLTEGQHYSAEGVAETALKGRLVPPDRFAQRMADDAAFRGQVLAAVARRFGEYERLVEDVALSGFDARLARALLALAGPDEALHITHEALAEETASGRAFVSRRLSGFAADGLIATQRGQITLLAPDRLRQIAADLG